MPFQWYYWNELKTVNVSNNIPLFKGMYLTGIQTEFYGEIHRQLLPNRVDIVCCKKILIRRDIKL